MKQPKGDAMEKVHGHSIVRVLQALIVTGCLVAWSLPAQAEPRSTITFENKSGEQALVKVVGKESHKAVVETEVADGGRSTVHVRHGNYYLLTRYGRPGHYRVAKGDPFDVREIGATYSEITITLHPVAQGNYTTHPTTLAEFDSAGVGGSQGAAASPGPTPRQVGTAATPIGSGFVVHPAGYVLTAAHVVHGAAGPHVMIGTQRYPATVMETDDAHDLALLKIEATGLPAVKIGNANAVSRQDAVWVLGYPFGTALTTTSGHITAIRVQEKQKLLQFDAALNPGNSGGPVVNSRGEVIGVATGKFLAQQAGFTVSEGMNVAVPISLAFTLLAQIPDFEFATVGRAPKELTGPDIDRLVSPAVVGIAVEARSGPGSATAGLSTERLGQDGASMVLVPAGEFMMGSAEGDADEQPVHRVALDAFYLDKYEMTNQRFQQFVQATGYQTTAEEGKAVVLTLEDKVDIISGANWRKPEGSETVFVSNRESHPVVQVSWHDAEAYCRWAGKRLPTEAEFEYANRAGTQTTYWWGDGNPGSRRVANIGDESAKRQFPGGSVMVGYDDGYVRTAPVGSFEPNPFGLHGTTGNVWEWTADWYGKDYYERSPSRNPTGASSGHARVLRGGSWFNAPRHLRSAFRVNDLPTYRDNGAGFRCAKTP